MGKHVTKLISLHCLYRPDAEGPECHQQRPAREESQDQGVEESPLDIRRVSS